MDARVNTGQGLTHMMTCLRLDMPLDFYALRQRHLYPSRAAETWHYVNMLDFPKFGGVPGLDRLKHFNTEVLPSPWMGDLRYTWQTPIPHPYPSVYRAVNESQRYDSTVPQRKKF